MFSKVSIHLPFLILAFLLYFFPSFGQTVESEEAFVIIEAMPAFKKGDLNKFLEKEIDYPEDAKANKIQGKVIVSFVVDEKGKVVDAKIIKGLGYGCDEEALNAIQATSGFWDPGKSGGRPVKVRQILPVKFALPLLPDK